MVNRGIIMKKSVIVLVIGLVISGTGIMSAGTQAPGFALVDNNGKFIYKSRLQGNLIISFWASYCKPCRNEMPHLVEIENKYGKSKDLHLILINIDRNDGSGLAKDKANKMLAEIGINHDYLLDMYQKNVVKYTPEMKVPSTFLVNKKGDIVFQTIGFHEKTLENLEKAIQKL